MTRPRPGIGSELLPLGVILASVALTLVLVVTMHRRGAVAHKPAEAPQPTPVVIVPPPVLEAVPEPPPLPPPPPPPPREDPTKKVVARLASAESAERLEAEKADRRAASAEAARQAAAAESERIRRRVALVRAQADDLSEKARALDQAADDLALERDVLARERDEAKAALAKAKTSSSYAVLPHKGPNGTWRKPVVIECANGAVKLQPDGPTFSLLDLSGLMSLRASPIVVAVARRLMKIEGSASPDGARVVPYIFFVVRPDGIRPYYEARARLEPLGIAFGYEMVDQNWEIDFSDPDNPAEASDPVPGLAGSARPGLGSRVADAGAGGGGLSWPGERAPRRGSGGQEKDPSEAFVWPAHPPGQGSGGGSPSGLDGRGGPGPGGNRAPGLVGGSEETGAEGGPSGHDETGGMGRRPFPSNTDDPTQIAGREGETHSPRPRTRGRGAEGEGAATPYPPADAPGPLTPALSPGYGGEGTGLPSARPLGNTVSADQPSGGGPGGQAGGSSGLVALGSEGMPPLESPESGDGSRGSAALSLAGQPPGGPANAPPGPKGAGSAPPGPLQPFQSTPPVGGPANAPPGPDGAGSALQGVRRPFQAAPAAGSEVLDAPAADGPQGGANGSGTPPAGRMPVLPSDLVGDQGLGGSASGDVEGGPANEKGGPRGGKRSSSFIEPKKIEVPFEITVACEAGGVLIYPGGYRLSLGALKDKELLTKELLAIVRLRRQVDPLIIPLPRIKFLVETGGSDTYWKVRRQVLLSKLDWPMALQVGDTSLIGFAPREESRR